MNNNRTLIQNSYLKQNKFQQKNILKKLNITEINNETNNNLLNLENENLIKFLLAIEEAEFEKIYTYSVIYNCFEVEELFNKILKENSYFNTNRFDNINNNFESPTLKILNNNEINIKFSLIKKQKNGNKFKYPIVISFFKDLKIAIIKLDWFESEIEENYITICKSIEKWFKDNFNIEISPHRTFYYAEKIMKNLELYSNIKRFILKANDPYDGRVKLRINQEEMLPILDDLKNLSENFKSENDKKLLIDFLKNLKESYSYLDIGLIFQWFTKNNYLNKHLKFVFKKDYLNNLGYTLIHCYLTSNSLEDFNYAIREIIKD